MNSSFGKLVGSVMLVATGMKLVMMAWTTIWSKLKLGVGCPENATPPSTKEPPDH